MGIKKYIVLNHLKLVIIFLLLLIIYRQSEIFEEAEEASSRIYYVGEKVDNISGDVNDIKDHLGIW
jgi:hypothetical protein